MQPLQRTWAQYALLGVVALLVATTAVLGVRDAQTRSRLTDAETALAETQQGVLQIVGTALDLQNQLGELGPSIRDGLESTRMQLEDFRSATLEFTVDISESIPIDATIDFVRTLQVPIRTELPINQEFDTTITVDGPFGIDIPIGVTVPIDTVVPVDLVVPFTIDESVPISTIVPVDLEVPIAFGIAGSELEALVGGLQSFVDALLDIVDSLG